jgi:hypothetical protein
MMGSKCAHYLDRIGEGEGHNIHGLDTGPNKVGGSLIDGSMKAGVGELRTSGRDDGWIVTMPSS